MPHLTSPPASRPLIAFLLGTPMLVYAQSGPAAVSASRLPALIVIALVAILVLIYLHRLHQRLHSAEQHCQDAKIPFQGLLEQAMAGIYLVRDQRFVYVNARFADIFGYPPEELVDRLGPLDLASASARPLMAEWLERLARKELSEYRQVIGAVRRNGSPIDIEFNAKRIEQHGQPALIGLVFEVTEAVRARQQLGRLAFYDALTDLPNRALFFDRLGEALVRTRRQGEGFGLMMLDLDGFKAINDTRGHDVGDALLSHVAERWRGCLRESDTLARTGGDEFMLILLEVEDETAAARVADKLLGALRAPFMFDGRECRIGVSIGVCLAPRDGDDRETLLRRVDAAMYRAKQAGRDRYCCFRTAFEPRRAACRTPFLAWPGELELGLAVIDEEHVRLAAAMNRLAEVLTDGQDRQLILSRFQALEAVTVAHFTTEERLMDEAGFAEAAMHKEHHRRLLSDLHSLRLHWDSSSRMLTLRSLKDWLVRHIRHDDRRLAAFLAARSDAIHPSRGGMINRCPDPESD